MTVSLSLSPTKCRSPLPLKEWKVRKKNGKITPIPPDLIKETLKMEGYLDEGETLIYRFKCDDGRRYYGSSITTRSNTFLNRLTTYERKINDEGLKRTYIESALNKHSSQFKLAIVDRKKNITEQEAHELEEKWQDDYDTRSKKHGFNIRKPTEERLRVGVRKKLHAVTKKPKPILLPREKKTQRVAFVKAFKRIAEEKSAA